jgi:hypothetical protein
MGQINKVSEVAVSLPFTISPYGTISATSDQSKIWADRVLSVLGTGIKERVMFPQFGSKLYDGLFSGSTSGVNSATDLIKNGIADSFDAFLPLLALEDVVTDFNTDSGALSVTILYTLPDKTLASTSLGKLIVNRNQPPIQEN